MKTKLTLRLVMLMLTIALMATACTTPPAQQPTDRGISGIATQVGGSVTRPPGGSTPSSVQGTGKAVLPNPSAGLAELKSYHAVIQVDAAGKLDGQPFERHTRVEITRAASGDFDNQVRLGSNDRFVRLLALNGAYYRWSSEEAACQGSIDPPSEDEVIEPAGLLLPVGSASRVGVETIGKVSSVHYRFDQTGLPYFKTSGAVTGDVWIAESGGYVVKYILKAGASQNPPAKGLDVAQTYTYELTPGGDAPGLPKGCAAVPADLPVIAGAQNVARTNGLVTYQASTTPRAVVDFYSQVLAGPGWVPEMKAPAGEIKLPYFISYTRDNLRLTLILSANEDGSLGVELVLVGLATQPGAATRVAPTAVKTPRPEPTANPAESGLPPGVPLYPGATGLIKAGGAVTFSTADPWKDVLAYYRNQMTANGWSITSEIPMQDGTTQMWQKSGVTVIVTIMADADKTRVVVTRTE